MRGVARYTPAGEHTRPRPRWRSLSLSPMGETMRRAGRATAQLMTAGGLALLSYLFLGLLLFTAVVTVIVVGAGVLPETVLLLRRMAGFKRRRVAAWSGVPVPEAYLPLTGALSARVRTALADPGTYRDLRWLAAHFGFGWLLAYLALPLWAVGLLVDGVWCGLLGRRAVVLPLIGRLADLDAAWSHALLRPSPDSGHRARLAERVEELTVTRAGAVAAHGAELRRIERDLHDGTQARLVALSMRVGLARRAYDKDPEAARTLLDDAQNQAEEALTELRRGPRHPSADPHRPGPGGGRAGARGEQRPGGGGVRGGAGGGPARTGGGRGGRVLRRRRGPDQRRQTQRGGPGPGGTGPQTRRVDAVGT